ncbi:MAG: hypothetical protein HN352_11915 [Bacteroidetes bacterium]|nr:hypothetical protein [Bacteroidota bacterium]MBT4399643.1 hypothetical protein [Bacteroidota bacterium]MBT4409723.1 hypothetical protein [Bacteroidota bacterium]MBT7462512.1 hypothetical protein [Bacteroidota bacterium]
MKTLCIILFGFLLPLCGSSQVILNDETVPQNSPLIKGKINILSTPDLLDITTIWANKYASLNSQLKITVLSSAMNKPEKLLPAGTDIRIISSEDEAFRSDKNLRKIIVGRDIIVPLINSENPFLEAIYKQGISAEEIARVLSNPDKQTWGMLLGNDEPARVNLFIIDNESVSSDVANFLNTDKLNDEGINVKSGQEMIDVLQGDPYALGFCRMTNVLDNTKNSFLDKITLLPIDKNGNGIIDYPEKIFSNYDTFTRGVWIGKYPKTLYRNIYSYSQENKSKEAVVAFLRWIVTSGQASLASYGYDDLVYSERLANIDALLISGVDPKSPNSIFAGQKLLALIIGLFIVTGLVVNIIARFVANKQASVQYASSLSQSVFDQNSVKILNGLYFDKTHTWAFMDQNGGVKIGIDDFLQHVTGPITRVKMKIPGERINKGDKIMSITQKGKQLNIYSPISGIIREQNTALNSDSSAMNSSPYSDGWVYVLEPTNWIKETQQLIMANNYKTWLKNEFSRLKDFLSASLGNRNPEHGHLVLQDGGELQDWVLEKCGPEVWEDFQINFIDTNK